MKQYAILDITDGVTLIQDGDTRDEAMIGLAEVAELGRTYVEVRRLGQAIVPRERNVPSITLARVPDGDSFVEPEPTEPEEAPEGATETGGDEVEEESTTTRSGRTRPNPPPPKRGEEDEA